MTSKPFTDFYHLTESTKFVAFQAEAGSISFNPQPLARIELKRPRLRLRVKQFPDLEREKPRYDSAKSPIFFRENSFRGLVEIGEKAIESLRMAMESAERSNRQRKIGTHSGGVTPF